MKKQDYLKIMVVSSGVWLDAELAALERTGGGISDIFSKIATKLTSERVKKVVEKAATAAAAAGARKAGKKAAEYASERLFKKPNSEIIMRELVKEN